MAVETFLPQDAAEGLQDRVNLNTAGLDELCVLPGIGEVRAQAIIDYRQAHGPFTRLDELLNVRGIGPKTLEALEGLVCF